MYKLFHHFRTIKLHFHVRIVRRKIDTSQDLDPKLPRCMFDAIHDLFSMFFEEMCELSRARNTINLFDVHYSIKRLNLVIKNYEKKVIEVVG